MLQALLIVAVMAHIAMIAFGYKVQLLAVTMFFLEHGGRMPDEAELERCR